MQESPVRPKEAIGTASTSEANQATLNELAQDSPRSLFGLSNATGFAAVLGLAVLLFLARYLGPAEWSDGYHQERAVAYAMDVLFNGNWLCQTGIDGDITSKPPLFTWLLALSNLAFGVHDFSLMLPPACATTALAMLIFFFGRRYFGPLAGLTAAVMYLISPLGAKEIVLIRIDVLFSLLVAGTALSVFEAWQKRGGWIWFWIMAALATLAKGPLGLLLGSAGLLAIFWERRTAKGKSERGRGMDGSGVAADKNVRALVGSHVLGILLYLLICGGWFGAAYLKMGKPLLGVMLGQELLGHVVQEKGGGPFSKFYLPFLYVCRCFVPWILFALTGFWRVIKAPAPEPTERRFERFVFAWFTGGLFIFSAAAHQRPDLIFPLMPAVALLAGREAAKLLVKFTSSQMLKLGGTVAAVGLALMIAKYHFLDARNDPETRTRAMHQMANNILSRGGGQLPLSHVDSPVALQFYLKTKQPLIPIGDAADLLRSNAPAFVAIRDVNALQQALGTNGPVTYELLSWVGRKDRVSVLSNRSTFE